MNRFQRMLVHCDLPGDLRYVARIAIEQISQTQRGGSVQCLVEQKAVSPSLRVALGWRVK